MNGVDVIFKCQSILHDIGVTVTSCQNDIKMTVIFNVILKNDVIFNVIMMSFLKRRHF